MFTKSKTKAKKGFTLIELLVVISIIGLLSTLAVVALNNARMRSRNAARVANIQQLQTAMNLFFDKNNTFAPTAATCNSAGDILTACTGTGATGLGDFMQSSVLRDPLSPTTPVSCTGSGGCVQGCTPGFYADPNATTYSVAFFLEDEGSGRAGTLPSGCNYLTQSGLRSTAP